MDALTKFARSGPFSKERTSARTTSAQRLLSVLNHRWTAKPPVRPRLTPELGTARMSWTAFPSWQSPTSLWMRFGPGRTGK